MLNERQMNIVFDLESTNSLITANYLAEKYQVSIRTIRNDIEEITYATNDFDIQFLRVPKMGMRIISTESVYKRLLNFNATSFSLLNPSQQNYFLSYLFLTIQNPLTLDYLTEVCQISKGTITSKLKQCDNYLNSFNLSLKSVRHKGNFLNGPAQNINDLIFDICDNLNFSVFSSSFSHIIFSKRERKLIEIIISHMAKEILYTPTNHDALELIIGFIIKTTCPYINSQSEEDDQQNTEFLLIGPNVANLTLFINSQLKREIENSYSSLLKRAILKYTDATSILRSSYATSDNLEKAVDLMLAESLKYYPELLDDINDLEKNLLLHLYYTINRKKANLDNKNPLLDQIKKRFPDEFNTVAKISKVFTNNYPLEIDEHENSYITLYFLNYLEKAKNRKRLNALLVCNSGVGATKLLYTKLSNNFPSIHIVNTSSYFDLKTDNVDLTGIDFIISTIKLPGNVSVPHIVVSPLLDYEDTLKINEMIPGSKSIMSNSEYSHNSINIQLMNEQNIDQGLLYSEITVEIYEMFTKLFPDGISSELYPSIVGLTSHIFMSLHRWKDHNYIKANDYELLNKEHPNEMSIINEFLSRLEVLLHLYIEPIEAIAILRYIIN